jgi:hypothetical protein
MPFSNGLEGVFVAGGAELILNRNHPIVHYLLQNQANPTDDSRFSYLHCLAGAVLEKGSLETLHSGNIVDEKFNWHFSNLGFHFSNIDWEQQASEYRPPYRCWTPKTGFFNITTEILTSLAKIQTIDWHRSTEKRVIT